MRQFFCTKRYREDKKMNRKRNDSDCERMETTKKKEKSEKEGNFFHVDSIRIKYERQIYFCHAFIDSRSFYDK